MKTIYILLISCVLLFSSFVNANSANKDYDLNDVKKNAKIINITDGTALIIFYGIDENKNGEINTVFIERIEGGKTEVLKYADTDYDGYANKLLFDRIGGADNVFEETTDFPSGLIKISDIFPKQ